MFKNLMRLVEVGVIVVLLLTVPTFAEAGKIQEIDAHAVKKMMDDGDVLVIFPLSSIEFNTLHIKDSINIPLDQLDSKLPEEKSQKLIFYCLGTKCVASRRAAEKAAGLGYEDVYAFREGLPGWIDAGYPTVTIEKIPEVNIDKISTAEVASKLATESIILVDINLNEDAHRFYIDHPKRVHIPLHEMQTKLSELDKKQQIVVMCFKGNRALIAARYLVSKGFENVVVVEGGLQKWVFEGRPIKQDG